MTGNTIRGNPGESWTRSVWIPSRREAGSAGTEVEEMQVRTEEVLVRKVIALELVSVDGVMERPEEWAFSYADDEMNEANAAGMAASDAMLLGRVTYEGLAAFWPNQPAGTPMVDYINSVPKFVVSKTLDEPLGWNNSALVEGDVAGEWPDLSVGQARTSRSSAAAPSSGRCSRRGCSTSSGSWSIR